MLEAQHREDIFLAECVALVSFTLVASLSRYQTDATASSPIIIVQTASLVPTCTTLLPFDSAQTVASGNRRNLPQFHTTRAVRRQFVRRVTVKSRISVATDQQTPVVVVSQQSGSERCHSSCPQSTVRIPDTIHPSVVLCPETGHH